MKTVKKKKKPIRRVGRPRKTKAQDNGKHGGGRPPQFDDPQVMQKLINEYFNKCPDTRQVVLSDGVINVPCPTITGLALFLGFCDRYAMYEYEKKEKFTNTIKESRARMVRVYEQQMVAGQCTGSIFMLKNFGYSDKIETEIKGELSVIKRIFKD